MIGPKENAGRSKWKNFHHIDQRQVPDVRDRRSQGGSRRNWEYSLKKKTGTHWLSIKTNRVKILDELENIGSQKNEGSSK